MSFGHARVPATSANLGPGFDALGIALALHNEVIVRDVDAPTGSGLSEAHREQAQAAQKSGQRVAVLSDSARHTFDSLPTDQSNIAWKAARRLMEFLGHEEADFRMETLNRIPLARGLGSSSAARVGALVAANEWARRKGWPVASREQLVSLACELEGHPDNAAAALLGGLVSSVMLDDAKDNSGARQTAIAIRLQVAYFPDFLVWIPDGELATNKARAALPDTFSRADAVFNISRTALLLTALATGETETLRHALHDRLHQPYRAPLVAGYDIVTRIAIEAGALGATLSGAGSSILIWLPPADMSTQAAATNAIEEATMAHDLKGELRALPVDLEGCVVMDEHAL